jgi:HD-GYP domain-containing protein (c-di-GMP phosphodiesterase class II)
MHSGIHRAAGLSERELRLLQAGAIFHDLGKISVRRSVLMKAGKLTAEEYDHVKTHASIGAQLLYPIEELRDAVPIIISHHERFDGGGYPYGIRATNISLGARITSIVDAFDAMTSDRPYRAAMPVPDAISRLCECAGSQFDPDLVNLFLSVAEANHLESSATWCLKTNSNRPSSPL